MKNSLLSLFCLFFLMPSIGYTEVGQVHAEWDYNSSVSELAGFRLYLEGNPEPVCATTEPTDRQLDCEVLLEEGPVTFTLTAFDTSSQTHPARTAVFWLNKTLQKSG